MTTSVDAEVAGAPLPGGPPPPGRRARPGWGRRMALRTALDKESSWRPRWLWAALSAPGALWLLLFFVVPFYVVTAIAFGGIDPLFRTPTPAWDPVYWTGSNLSFTWQELTGKLAFLGSPILRTIWYTAAASALSMLIAYPVAYFVARYGGRRKALYLVALIAPFFVSYMMRMLAWIDLLQVHGYVNRVINFLGLGTVNWLGGKSITVILGLVYGYIPYLVIVLYAGLDRIDQRHLEAARDLGLTRAQTFVRVTLPLSRPTLLAGGIITVLPMLGDYYTNQLLSGSPHTTMIGNVIEGELGNPLLVGQGDALAMLLLIVLLIPLVYYVRQTARMSAELA
ncbi:MAG: ABC transporter permease [Acidimicrobiales bacterium]